MPTPTRELTLPPLPDADTRLLARPPLELVICEVRTHADPGATLRQDDGLRLKEAASAAGFEVQRLEQAQQQALRMQVTVGIPTTPTVETVSMGWQLISNDPATTLTVLPGVLTVQTTHYVSWEDTFRPLLRSALTAVSDVLEPHVRQRVGLRYVDRLTDPKASSAIDWRSRIADGLLGPLADPMLGKRVITAQQQIELLISDHQRASLRHGPFQDRAERDAFSYMIDIDAFDVATTAFDLDGTLSVADELNHVALSLFQAALRSDYLTELREGP